ncbi:MAG TPA: PDZ domain-containing protein [Planctomycetota bacterium]|nr:PDZ domain-containing protein [Planctomycetota bacterium]
MRLLLPGLLLLICAPLLAQEPSEADRRAEEERKAAEAKADDKRREEIERIARQRAESEKIARMLDELRSKSEATREQAMEAIKQANLSLDQLLPLITEALERAESARNAMGFLRLAAPTRTLVVGTEAISGSADGTDYTLKSLGEGKYELNATKKDGEGRVMEQTADKGTMKELQEKYAFLRSALAIQVPAPAPRATVWGFDTATGSWAGRVVDQNGNAVQAATWNGGGRVGVNVTPPPEELCFHLQLPEGAGFIVQQVVPGSRAEQIGIRRMDVLLRLDGELIDSPLQLRKLHENKGVLEIIRRAESRKIDLKTLPEEKPAEAPQEEAAEPAATPEGAR